MVKKNYLQLKDLQAYKVSSELSDIVWNQFCKMSYFEKKTIGIQMVKSFDSISANIAEGWGRYHKKDKQKFYYNARGSTYESIHWLRKAYKRGLLPKEQYLDILSKVETLPKEINQLIKITEIKLKE